MYFKMFSSFVLMFITLAASQDIPLGQSRTGWFSGSGSYSNSTSTYKIRSELNSLNSETESQTSLTLLNFSFNTFVSNQIFLGPRAGFSRIHYVTGSSSSLILGGELGYLFPSLDPAYPQYFLSVYSDFKAYSTQSSSSQEIDFWAFAPEAGLIKQWGHLGLKVSIAYANSFTESEGFSTNTRSFLVNLGILGIWY